MSDATWGAEVGAAWARLHPGVDAETWNLVYLLSRTNAALEEDQAERFAELSLTRGEVGVMAALRAHGPPHRLSPGRLAQGLLLSSAGITGRLDRLERRGLIRRLPDPTDRRGAIVELTTSGVDAVDGAVLAYTGSGNGLVRGLSTEESRRLAALLGKLLRGLRR